ncbi:hypothetical protein LCM17_14555 [Cereibacter sphaeroides]|nr:hypothetical protein [Cereibacter sphaeroides]
MAKFDEDAMRAALSPLVPEGTAITHAAYGVRQPSLWVILPAFAVAILPGVILTQMLTKHYLVGLAGDRVVVMQFKPRMAKMTMAVGEVKDSFVQPLSEMQGKPVTASTGKIFTKLGFPRPEGAFFAKFHRAFSKTNRPSAMAIAEAVQAAA